MATLTGAVALSTGTAMFRPSAWSPSQVSGLLGWWEPETSYLTSGNDPLTGSGSIAGTSNGASDGRVWTVSGTATRGGTGTTLTGQFSSISCPVYNSDAQVVWKPAAAGEAIAVGYNDYGHGTAADPSHVLYAQLTVGTTNNVVLAFFVAGATGTTTYITGSATISTGTAYTVRVYYDGATLLVKINGTTIVTATPAVGGLGAIQAPRFLAQAQTASGALLRMTRSTRRLAASARELGPGYSGRASP